MGLRACGKEKIDENEKGDDSLRHLVSHELNATGELFDGLTTARLKLSLAGAPQPMLLNNEESLAVTPSTITLKAMAGRRKNHTYGAPLGEVLSVV